MQPGLSQSRFGATLKSWQRVGRVAHHRLLMMVWPRKAVGVHGLLEMRIRVAKAMWWHAGHPGCGG